MTERFDLLAVTLLLPPDIKHNLAVKAHVTGIGLQLPDERLELALQYILCHAGAAISTVIVGVIPVAAFRPASRERTFRYEASLNADVALSRAE